MTKLGFHKPWESTIAVLEDNIFLTDISRWKSAISEITSKTAAPAPIADERRREPRFSLSLPVLHRVRGIHGTWKRGSSIDVSQNGIRLVIQEKAEVGTRLELDIKLPQQEKRVRLEGIVIWIKPSFNSSDITECGVAFQNLRLVSKKERLIHFMADRLCRMALNHHHDLRCRIASTKQDLLDAYALVYREYIQRGYCKANTAERHYNAYCFLPGTRTFLLEQGHQLLGTLSLIPDSKLGLPMERLFSDRMRPIKHPGTSAAEIGLLALDHNFFGHKSFALTDFKKLAGSFKLFKIIFDYARFQGGITDLFITMHPRHKELYEYLTFRSIGPVRSYAGAEGNPALPMHMNISHSIAHLPRDLGICKYFVDELLPPDLLKSKFSWNENDLRDFLHHLRPLWQELSAEEIDVLRSSYPTINLQP